MPQSFVVIVPHQLGKQAARERLERGFNRIRSEVAAYTTSMDSRWSGDQLIFSVQAVGHRIAGKMDVLEDAVRVEVDLPWLLALAAEKIVARIQQTGRALLK